MMRKNLAALDIFESAFMLAAYLLGLGIVRYLGEGVDVLPGMLGFLVLLFAGVGFRLLDRALEGVDQIGLVTPAEVVNRRRSAIQLAFAFFGLSAAVILGLLYVKTLSALAGAVVVAFFLLSFVAVAPRWGGAVPGLKNLLRAFVAGTVAPLAACAFQSVPAGQLLPALTFPLVLSYLAALVVAEFRSFAADTQALRRSMTIDLGWRNALRVHQALVTGTMLLLGLDLAFGVPWKLILPAFLALPFAAVQFLWMRRIGRGGATRWSFILPLSRVNPLLLAYLLMMPLWLD